MKEQAPHFELPYITGESTYNLEDDIEKVIVLTFWTSWCPDCGKDLPKKEQLYSTVDHEKVKMVTINVSGRERDVKEGVEFAEKFLNQPTLVDEGRMTYDLYACQGVPTTIIIDQQGNIHDRFGDQASFLDVVESLGALI
ncbi:TlpA family protein disulfide reductase [Halobacillus sp. H74]|uniref:TlpA family protein disulfide reductase n=1 Tax=Halobacillus sp. H74 TaxID=3457436 RepID=UPI003FCE3596